MAAKSAELMAEIERLSAQNCQHRSAITETRLIELRQQAGELLASDCKDAAPMPSPVPDLNPDQQTIVEIPAKGLNGEVLASALMHHGVLLVRNLYSDQQIERLATVNQQQLQIPKSDYAPLGCSPHTLFELLSVYEECGLLPTVREYLGPQPLLFGERAKLRLHTAAEDKMAALPWHQDVNFFGAKSYSLNCWAALTPCGEHNPGMAFVPRRLEERVGWNEQDGTAPLDYGRTLSDEELATAIADSEVARPILEPGDALLFDEMTLHQTALKHWSLDRQLVSITWFFRREGFPDWGTALAV